MSNTMLLTLDRNNR